MEKQLIISVGREFGSGGHLIAEELAKHFEIPLYDHNLLEHIAQEMDLDHATLKKYDEKPKSKLFNRTVGGHSNSPEDHIANLQFTYLRNMASDGKSFVIVGRCAETKLSDFPALISIFVRGRRGEKVKTVMETFNVDEEDAKYMMQREDWKKKSYHNYYCKGKWGDSRNYDLVVDSGRLGIEGTVDFLIDYIKRRMVTNESNMNW